MCFMKRLNDCVARVVVVFASICLAALTVLVFYSVVMRYVFDDAPDFVEPIALLLVVVIALFGAALKVREGGHIGLDSMVKKMPPKAQVATKAFQHLCLIAFAVAILIGCIQMAQTTMDDQIPILGIPEAVRYFIPTVAGLCIMLFSLEHLMKLFVREGK